jgi:hypothetical protein
MLIKPFAGVRRATNRAREWKFFRGQAEFALTPFSQLTRTGLGTRIGPTGLVGYGPHNLASYSRDYSGTGWARGGVTVSGSAGSQTVSANTSSGSQYLLKNISAAVGDSVVVTLELLAGNASTFCAGLYSSGFITVASVVTLSGPGALSGGTGLLQFSGLSATVPTILQFRCTTTVANPDLFIYPGATAGSSQVAGASTVISRVITSNGYAPTSAEVQSGSLDTTTSARYLPRITHDPVTFASMGLLIEGSESNEVSTNLANWASSLVNRTYNAAASPDGGANAVNLVPTTANAFHHIEYSAATGANGQSRLTRWYLKPNGYNFALIWLNTVNQGLMVNITTGATSAVAGGATLVENYLRPDGWRVVSVLATQSGASAAPAIYPFPTSSANAFAGDGTSGILVWQPKVSNSTALTSDIPNPGTGTAVRAADDWYLSGSAFSSIYNASEGTLFGAVTLSDLPSIVRIAEFAGATPFTHRILVYTTGNQLYLQVRDGTDQANPVASVTLTAGVEFKFAISYKANEFKILVNGGSVTSDLSGTVPAGMSALTLGWAQSGTTDRTQTRIRAAMYYPTALSDAALQALTA